MKEYVNAISVCMSAWGLHCTYAGGVKLLYSPVDIGGLNGAQNILKLVQNIAWVPQPSIASKPIGTLHHDVWLGIKLLSGTGLSAGVSMRF